MRRTVFLFLLVFTEYLYLKASGWTRDGRNRYTPPIKYKFRRLDLYTRGHAINAQKQLDFNPMHGGRRAG